MNDRHQGITSVADAASPNQDIGEVFYGEMSPNMITLLPEIDNTILLGAVFAPVVDEIVNDDLTFEQAKARVMEIIAENNFGFTE